MDRKEGGLRHLQEDIISQVQKHAKRHNMPYNMVLKSVLIALTATILEDPSQKPEERMTGQIKKRPPVSDTDETDSMIELKQLQHTKKERKGSAPDELMSKMKSGRHEFNTIMARMEREQKWWTDSQTEVYFLRLHLLPASIVYRIPHTKDSVRVDSDLASRILDAAQHPARVMGQTEKKCLLHLNKVTESTYTYNRLTFVGNGFCGTPDALLRKGTKIIAVAEFKPLTEQYAGKYQLLAYMEMLNVDVGYVCLDCPDGSCMLKRYTLSVSEKNVLHRKKEAFFRYKKNLK